MHFNWVLTVHSGLHSTIYSTPAVDCTKQSKLREHGSRRLNLLYLCPDDYQTRCSRGCSTNSFVTDSFINSVSEWSFSSRSSKNHNSQTVRARQLTFWDIVHHPLCVTCHMSCFTCHLSGVTCHVSHVICHMSNVTCHVPHVTCQVSHV